VIALVTAALILPAAPGSSVSGEMAAAPEVVLYDQYNNPAAGEYTEVPSQEYEFLWAAFTNQAADDFDVPVGWSWSITGVDVDGESGGEATAYNVYFHADSNGLPGALTASRLLQPFTGTSGDAVVALSCPVFLSSGTHWVSVQARQDFTTDGHWLWKNRTVQSSSAAAWRNPGDGIGTGCTDWDIKTTCMTFQVGPDQVFRIHGNLNAGTYVFSDGFETGLCAWSGD
jgi:hypothetical protein